MSKEEYLEKCFKEDKFLEITSAKISNGKKEFTSKWERYSEVVKRKKSLILYNLRTILRNEIVIEFDNKYGVLTKEVADRMIEDISIKLEKEGINHEVWDYEKSVSKHLHIKGIAFLNDVDTNQRRFVKMAIATHFCDKGEMFFQDNNKFSNRTLIALEDCSHWKYGTMKTLVEKYSEGSTNKNKEYFSNIVNPRQLHSNSSNMSNRSNISNRSNLNTITKDLVTITTLITDSNRKLQRLNKKRFNVIESDNIKEIDFEWYKSKDFSKGGLTYKPKEDLPYTTLHRGINIIRFYKKVKNNFIMGKYPYQIFEVKAFFMLKLKYEQFGYLAIPKKLGNDIIIELERLSLEKKLPKNLEFMTLIINKYGNKRYPRYEFQILNHTYTNRIVKELELIRSSSDNFFEDAIKIVPQFVFNKLIREKQNIYRANVWSNKWEKVMKKELKNLSHDKRRDLVREMLKLGTSREEIHKGVKKDLGNEYNKKITDEQIDNISKYIKKQRNVTVK